MVGGGTNEVFRSMLLTQGLVLLGALAILLLFLRALPRRLDAAVLLLMLALTPGLFLLYQNPMSEALFVVLFYAGLALAVRGEATRSGALLAFAPLARMIAVTVVPALLLWRWRSASSLQFRERLQRAAPPLLCLLPALGWISYRRFVP
jgi:hypothetical protein